MQLKAYIFDWNTEKQVIASEYYVPKLLSKTLNNPVIEDEKDDDEEEDDNGKTYDYYEEEEEDEDDESGSTFKKEPMTIYCFGVNEDGKSVMVRINNVRPMFFIRLPDDWDGKKANQLIKLVRMLYFTNNPDGIVSTKIITKFQFDGFTNKSKFPFLKVEFDSMMSFYIYRKKFDNTFTYKPLGLNKHKFKLYESDLDQLLRFFHKNNLNTCGWLTFEFEKYNRTNQSKCAIEYEVDVTDLKISDNTEITKAPQIPVASFDIECTRGSGDGAFPQFDDPKDHVIQVGITTNMYGCNEVHERYISVLGSCDPIPGVTVEAFANEKDVILAAARYISKKQIGFLSGYNIYGFDMRYLYKRAELLKIEHEFLHELSRIRNAPAQYEEKKLVSSGLGDNSLYLLNIPGIVSVDVMKVLQGDPSFRLASWKLDHVAEIFMGQNKNDLKPNDIFRLFKGDANDRKIIAEYCIQDCVLVNNLINKLCILTNKMAMANVCSVPVSYIFLRGQGIKIFSLVAKFCYERNFLIPTKDRNAPRPTEKYQGAIVLNAKRGYYSDPVFVLDFNSLYPSSQITANLSHDTFVNDPKYDNLEGVQYRSVSYIEGGRTVTHKWAKIADEEGILPQILKKLLSERKAAKKLMEKETDPFIKAVYDGKQNALKVTCNSVYGQCGAFTSNIYLRELAACTTALGREFLTFSKNYTETNYPGFDCVYGDSVASYTPILVAEIINEHKQVYTYRSVEEIAKKFGNNKWYSCIEDGKQDKEFCPILNNRIHSWTDKGWTPLKNIIRHKLASHKKMIRVITKNSLVDVTDDHSLLRDDTTEVSPKEVNIGDALCHRDLPHFKLHEYDSGNSFDSQEKAAAYYWKLRNKNEYRIVISQQNNYTIVEDKETPINKVLEKYEIPYEGYVYDLTTENHHFAAGIGNMIVHNTDSIFVKPLIPGKEKMTKLELLSEVVRLGEQVSKEITAAINHPAMNLAYEKVFYPFGLFQPKRYTAIKYERPEDKGKYVSMGDELKRRSTSPICKTIYKGLRDMLFTYDAKPAKEIDVIRYYLTQIRGVLNAEFPLEEFIISVTLKSYYKRPESIPHNVLADRIQARGGERPEPNERMQYVFVEKLNEKKHTPGSNIEEPSYTRENNLKIDYLHYVTNSIMKPTLRMLELFSETPQEYISGIVAEAKKKRNEDVRKYMNHSKGFKEIHEMF